MEDQHNRYIGTETEFELIGHADYAYQRGGLGRSILARLLARKLYFLDHPDATVPITDNFEEARYYVDYGDHPEYCTPETYDFRDVPRLEMTGEERFGKALLALVAEFEEGDEIGNFALSLSKKTTDQAGTTTWGMHESNQIVRFENFKDRKRMRQSLAAQYISRLPLTGAGGYTLTETGWEYHLSPRAQYHLDDIGSDTTMKRPVVNTRDEPLDDEEWFRIHNTTAEGNMSPWQIYYKSASTALIAKAMESGVFIDDLAPAREDLWGKTMRMVGADPTLRASYDTADSSLGRLNTLDIQRKIVKRVSEFAETEAELELVDEWRRMIMACVILRDTGKVNSDAMNLDYVVKREYINKRANTMAKALDTDLVYHMVINHKGTRGIGHILRNNGRFRMTPDDWSAENHLNTNMSERARNRGILARSPGVNVVDWHLINREYKKSDGTKVMKQYSITEEGVRTSSHGDTIPVEEFV